MLHHGFAEISENTPNSRIWFEECPVREILIDIGVRECGQFSINRYYTVQKLKLKSCRGIPLTKLGGSHPFLPFEHGVKIFDVAKPAELSNLQQRKISRK